MQMCDASIIFRIIHRYLNNREGPFRLSENSQADQMAYANCAINQLIELQVWPNNRLWTIPPSLNS